MMLTVLKDWLWWYKQQAPKYGYFDSITYSYFNARYFTRDGNWRKATHETQ